EPRSRRSVAAGPEDAEVASLDRLVVLRGNARGDREGPGQRRRVLPAEPLEVLRSDRDLEGAFCDCVGELVEEPSFARLPRRALRGGLRKGEALEKRAAVRISSAPGRETDPDFVVEGFDERHLATLVAHEEGLAEGREVVRRARRG